MGQKRQAHGSFSTACCMVCVYSLLHTAVQITGQNITNLHWQSHHINHIISQIKKQQPKMRKRGSGANHWPHGRPRKRYKDKLKRIIISCNLSPSNWEEVAFYHSNWHSLSADGVLQFETSHITKAKAKREHSKTAENSAASSSPSVISVDACAVLALHLWATYPLSNISIICVLISNICARQLSSLLMDCNATQLSLATFVLAADADESHIHYQSPVTKYASHITECLYKLSTW